MQIVIDIDEETLQDLYDSRYVSSHIKDVFRSATPLPEGHGRLIDGDAFQKYCFNKNFDGRLSEDGLFFINLFLDNAPTIIEADKE